VTEPGTKAVHTGGCQCGAVRYALLAEPTGGSICHCRMCQKALGNLFAPYTGVRRRDFAWTRGTPGLFRSSNLVERGFCRDCGTPLTFAYVEADRISVTIGSLDRPEAAAIAEQFGIESRLPAFATLHLLPESTTEGSNPPGFAGRVVSRQHPDRD
jgi:hypothetical protein